MKKSVQIAIVMTMAVLAAALMLAPTVLRRALMTKRPGRLPRPRPSPRTSKPTPGH